MVEVLGASFVRRALADNLVCSLGSVGRENRCSVMGFFMFAFKSVLDA